MFITGHNITKTFRKAQALKGLNFSIDAGELFGFIGPDGAGKSTLFRIITTLLIPDSGEVLIQGLNTVKDYKKIRKITGYMPGRFSLYQDLSVEENLKFYADIFDTSIKENYSLIRNIYHQIEPYKKRRAGDLSGGMKQKLALSCALIHRPLLLVLDEPTTGVDAVSRKEFWEILSDLKKEGITTLISTPYMDEAELCDRVALMQEGRIMQIEKPCNIREQFDKKLLSIKSKNIYKLLKDLRAFSSDAMIFPFGQHIHYSDISSRVFIPAIHEYLLAQGHEDCEILETKANIEDCFMDLMITRKSK
jgi:ABC-2 type transport system ATP-binding protein